MTDISEDSPLRLKDAVKIAFPAGGMSVSGLRQEHLKGRLKLEKIAGKHFVTLRSIREMRERCEDVPQARETWPRRMDDSPIPPTVSEQDLAEARIRLLRKRLRKMR